MARKRANPFSPNDEQSVPGPVSPEAIQKELEVMRYVEKETNDEKVLFLEMVQTEQVFDNYMEVWNVHTDKQRYWVITNPAGLYSQGRFPSLDYAVTFHVGLTVRIAADQHADAVEKEQDLLAYPWWRWEQAVVALDKAHEAEEFQAVGILCRECLLSFIKTVLTGKMVPVSQNHRPKMEDFVSWSEQIVDALTLGPGAKEIRAYLRTISKAGWQLVNGLAHAANPTRFDANMAIQATENILAAFGAALFRHRNRIPDRCPRCSSYQVTSVYRPDLDLDPPYVALCEICGWMDGPKDSRPASQHPESEG